MERYEGRKKLKYRYYQTPDGEEYLNKLWFLTKPAIDMGLFFGVTDVIIVTKPTAWLPLIERFVKVSIRPVLTAFLFETSVYMATKIRKKDDGFNHVFGGMVCGYYWSRFIAYHPITVPLTLLTCAVLYNCKDQKMKGGLLFYDEYALQEDHDYGAWIRFNTWSPTDKHPRTWLTSEEAAAKGIEV